MPRTLKTQIASLTIKQGLNFTGDAPEIKFIVPESIISAETTTWVYQFRIIMPQDFCFYYNGAYEGERPKITLIELLKAGRNYFLDNDYPGVHVYQLLDENNHNNPIINIRCNTVQAIECLYEALNRFFEVGSVYTAYQAHVHEVKNAISHYAHSQDTGSDKEPPAIPQPLEHKQFPDSINEAKLPGEHKYNESKMNGESKHGGASRRSGHRSALMPANGHQRKAAGESKHQIVDYRPGK
jgi:hypothetical protein